MTFTSYVSLTDGKPPYFPMVFLWFSHENLHFPMWLVVFFLCANLRHQLGWSIPGDQLWPDSTRRSSSIALHEALPSHGGLKKWRKMRVNGWLMDGLWIIYGCLWMVYGWLMDGYSPLGCNGWFMDGLLIIYGWLMGCLQNPRLMDISSKSDEKSVVGCSSRKCMKMRKVGLSPATSLSQRNWWIWSTLNPNNLGTATKICAKYVPKLDHIPSGELTKSNGKSPCY